MLSKIKESDRKVPEIRKKWEARRNKKLEIGCENCKIEAVMSKCSRSDHKQLEHSNKKGIEAEIGMLHPEGTKINSKEPTWLACPGPKGLASKKGLEAGGGIIHPEGTTPIGVVSSGTK